MDFYTLILLVQLLADGQKIRAIKLIKQAYAESETPISLMTAKAVIDALIDALAPLYNVHHTIPVEDLKTMAAIAKAFETIEPNSQIEIRAESDKLVMKYNDGIIAGRKQTLAISYNK